MRLHFAQYLLTVSCFFGAFKITLSIILLTPYSRHHVPFILVRELPNQIHGVLMNDERCCGTGTCIINAEGYCWCGQQWDGEKMCFPEQEITPDSQEVNDAEVSSSSHQSG